MAKIIQDETLTDIADAIRVKGGLEGEIKVEDFAQLIQDLPTCDNTQRAETAADKAEEKAKEAYASAVSAATSASQVKNVESVVVGAADQETARINNENTRIANENARISAESNRAAAETSRVQAERTRVDETDKIITKANGIITTLENVSKDSLDSEAWAVGTRGGNPIVKGQHDAYENNAKFYADETKKIYKELNLAEISDTKIQELWNSIVK